MVSLELLFVLGYFSYSLQLILDIKRIKMLQFWNICSQTSSGSSGFWNLKTDRNQILIWVADERHNQWCETVSTTHKNLIEQFVSLNLI